jgi:hypothetical protein
MPHSIQELRSQRDTVLERMKQIDPLRRGSFSRQFFKTQRDGKTLEFGPYFVLQRFFNGKKCSERIPASQAQQVQAHVQNFRLFNELAEEFTSLSDQITRLECVDDDSKKNALNRRHATKNGLKNRKPS